MPRTLAEIGKILEVKRAELHTLFEKAKTDRVDEEGRPLFDMDATMIKAINDRNEELNDLNDEYEAARAQEIYAKNLQEAQRLNEVERNVNPAPTGRNANTRRYNDGPIKLSEMVMESREYKARAAVGYKFSVELDEVDIKTLMTTSAGFAPPNDRTNRVVLSAQRRPVVADLIPSDPTNNSLIKWMEETTFTNNAGAVAEGGTKPESALSFTERTQAVEKIATWLPVTEEQLDDVAQARNLIDNRLMLMLMLKEENDLLNANGTTPNLMGFLNKPGVQTQAKGIDPIPDAFYKAYTKVRWTGYAEPSGNIIHPNDWQDVRLMRTTEGLYIWGNPSEDGPDRLWGKPVVVTNAIAENTGLTGDFVLFSHISRKMGARIDVSDSHASYFVENKLAIRIEERLSLEIFRASAFCTVTGI